MWFMRVRQQHEARHLPGLLPQRRAPLQPSTIFHKISRQILDSLLNRGACLVPRMKLSARCNPTMGLGALQTQACRRFQWRGGLRLSDGKQRCPRTCILSGDSWGNGTEASAEWPSSSHSLTLLLATRKRQLRAVLLGSDVAARTIINI